MEYVFIVTCTVAAVVAIFLLSLCFVAVLQRFIFADTASDHGSDHKHYWSFLRSECNVYG